MNTRYTYFLIDLLVIVFPLLLSLTSYFPFYKQWKFFFKVNLVVSFIFVIWDDIFTSLQVWAFNEKYISGIKISHLPIEEILFFIAIPYACAFSHFVIRQNIRIQISKKMLIGTYSLLIVMLLLTAFLHIEKLYTSITFIALSIFMAYLIIKKRFIFLSYFTLSYLFVIPFFLLTNGILTGGLLLEQPIVMYSSEHILNIRLLNIPLEDFFYAMLLLVLNNYYMDYQTSPLEI